MRDINKHLREMENYIEYFEKTSTQLAEIKEPLESISRNSEPKFINLGDKLQSVFAGAEDLTRLTMETARLIDGKSEGNVLGNISEFAQQSLNDIESYRTDVSAVLPNIEASLKYLKQLYGICPVIRRIAKTLNTIALNISIESSRTKDREEMFEIFVMEIKDLARRVDEISRKIRDDSKTAHIHQSGNFFSISNRINQLDEIADESQSTVQKNIQETEKLIQLSLKALRRSEIHSKNISNLVGDIVMAIQFHDIARQQLEHIIQALMDIENLCNEEISGIDESGDLSNVLNHIHSILSLQTKQIRQVIEEIEGAREKTTRSFDEVGQEVEALVAGIAPLGSDTTQDDNHANAFRALITGLGHMDLIMTQGNELAEKIDDALKHSSQIVSRLSGYLDRMEDMGTNLHIKAINALIMSNRLGESGGAFSVLAQDVTVVSKESNEFVSSVVDILNSIGDLANDLKQLSVGEEISSNGTGSHSLSGIIHNISGIYDHFNEDSSLSFERTMALKEEILNIKSNLVFLDEIKDDLTRYLHKVEDIINILKPFSTAEEKKEDHRFEDIAGRYTMESERAVHEVALKGESDSTGITKDNNTPPKGSPGTDKKEKDIDDLGDNVELF